MRHLQVRVGLSFLVSWNKLSTTVKWQSWRSRHAQEEMLTKGKVQHWWEGGGDGGGWGRPLENSWREWVSYRRKAHQNKPKPFLFAMVCLVEKKPTYWVYFSDAQESKPCISLSLGDAPHFPSPFLRFRRLTAATSTKCIRATKIPKGGINTMAWLTARALATGKYGRNDSIASLKNAREPCNHLLLERKPAHSYL